MLSKFTGWDDTIVALATPPGIGALGVIRVSGPASFTIIRNLFPSKDLEKAKSHTLHYGLLKDGDDILDDVMVSLYKSPRSYTGEDVIEISCHGSPFVQQTIIEAIIRCGARLAKPGEFTQRAFLNRKLDLTQAEAVADLIASNAEASRKAAIQNMRGGFSILLRELRDELIGFSSLIELELDFAEEDVEFADRTKFCALIEKIIDPIKKLLHSFKLGNVIKNGVSVAIVGQPNAGKSTLLNTLLNENRAIVSEIAGTTRDTIEEVINIEGILFRLIDTAGIREHTHDVIEHMGVMRSLEKIKEADIVLYLLDLTTIKEENIKSITNDMLSQEKKYLLVGNKSDTLNNTSEKPFLESYNILLISAKENTGVDQLKRLLFSTATGNRSLIENVIITNARHFEALQQVDNSLSDILAGLSSGVSTDLLTPDIRRCLHYFGEITGEITNEDRLDFIFSKFCIGK